MRLDEDEITFEASELPKGPKERSLQYSAKPNEKVLGLGSSRT